jgi:N-acetyl-S-(2-succino)cysteine monooxygenase
MTRRLHLNAFLMGVGHHEAAWRLPETDVGGNLSLAHFTALARTAERGAMDSIFFADAPAIMGDVRYRPVGQPDPTVLLGALAASTERIGLIATASTTYEEPYNLARRFAAVDHLSGGRAGWNIVTTASPDASRNFGLDEQPAHRDRYARADEFVAVVEKLWDSWEDDAVLGDKAGGEYADGDRIHAIDHRGEHFSVQGPLDLPRTAQGRPVLVQAGSSETGKAFAARWAEAVFTAHQTLEDGQAFYRDLKARADGRELKILPGLVPVIGSTEAEAKAAEEALEAAIVPAYGLKQLSVFFGIDMTGADLDAPLPPLPAEDEIEAQKSRFTLVTQLARRENLTVRQLLGRLGGGRGHRTFTGTPEQVADTMQEWFEQGAADGFNVMPPVLPGGLDLFVDHVIPELRRRGLFREEYEGTTLREHLGLERPASRYAGRERVAA